MLFDCFSSFFLYDRIVYSLQKRSYRIFKRPHCILIINTHIGFVCIFIVTVLCVFIINTHTTFFCGIFVTCVLRFYDKYPHMRSCMESLSRPHCLFMINIHTAVLRGILVTAASRICGKNAHVRSHEESWSRPQMRIHDISFV